MSRERVAAFGEMLGERWGEAFARFRESRLYVQVLLAAGLVAVTGIVAAFPAGPLSRVKAALTWTVTQDYDFKGRAVAADRWAKAKGGWVPAMAATYQGGVARVKGWSAHLPSLPGATEPSTSAPATESATPTPAPAPAPSTPVKAASVMPVQGTVIQRFDSPGGSGRQYHEALDIAAPVGTPVVAFRDGTVKRVYQDQNLGTVIEVEHGTLLARYGEVSAVRVQAGDRVTQGQSLATVAPPSGAESKLKAHLHFEVRPAANGYPVDPAPLLPLGGKPI